MLELWPWSPLSITKNHHYEPRAYGEVSQFNKEHMAQLLDHTIKLNSLMTSAANITKSIVMLTCKRGSTFNISGRREKIKGNHK